MKQIFSLDYVIRGFAGDRRPSTQLQVLSWPSKEDAVFQEKGTVYRGGHLCRDVLEKVDGCEGERGTLCESFVSRIYD